LTGVIMVSGLKTLTC